MERLLETPYVKEMQAIGQLAWKKELCAANDGNFSVRLKNNDILCTISGVSKGCLKEDCFTIINPEGTSYDLGRTPSSEMKMHRRIYECRKDVGAVVHLHAPYTLLLSLTEGPDFHYETPIIAENIIGLGKVPIVPFSLPGSDEVPDQLEPWVNKCEIAVLANHGTVAWGPNLSDAYYKIETLEMFSKIYYLAQSVPHKKLHMLPTEELERLKGLRSKYFPNRKYWD